MRFLLPLRIEQSSYSRNNAMVSRTFYVFGIKVCVFTIVYS